MGKNGCLVIHDPLVHDQFIVTNDLVSLLSPEQFRLLGRIDHVINSGGVKVQPEELEDILSPGISGIFCISSVEDHRLGEMVVLVVEKGTDQKRLNEWILKIDKYKQPKKIVEFDSIPLLSNGKIDYKKVKSILIEIQVNSG
jgi:o-succinylbenzoate---CoA ligase